VVVIELSLEEDDKGHQIFLSDESTSIQRADVVSQLNLLGSFSSEDTVSIIVSSICCHFYTCEKIQPLYNIFSESSKFKSKRCILMHAIVQCTDE
jgi:hypothetical protein